MEVQIAETAAALGARAAHDIAASLREMQQQQKRIRVIFAAAPSRRYGAVGISPFATSSTQSIAAVEK